MSIHKNVCSTAAAASKDNSSVTIVDKQSGTSHLVSHACKQETIRFLENLWHQAQLLPGPPGSSSQFSSQLIVSRTQFWRHPLPAPSASAESLIPYSTPLCLHSLSMRSRPAVQHPTALYHPPALSRKKPRCHKRGAATAAVTSSCRQPAALTRLTAQPALTHCWVMQWMLPALSRTSRDLTPTTL